MTTRTSKYEMLPYRRQGEIDYAALDFDPDVTEPPEDAMEQNRELPEIESILVAYFTDFNSRPDVFLDRETNICYDPANLNVRIVPDLYLAFGVDAAAIRPRKLYLPWEVGKPPDWVLEIASESTARRDVSEKPAIYARVGGPEYWRFDPTGGRYHGQPLYGGRLVGGEYQAIELTNEPDGILKAYSQVLELSLCWDDGWPRFYNPSTGAYLDNWQQEREAHRAALEVAETRVEAAKAERDAAQAEAERLRERLRRLESSSP